MDTKFSGSAHYVASQDLMETVNIAVALQKPLLIKGEPGTGKTMLAQAVAEALGYSAPAVEGVDYRFSLCGSVYMDGASAVIYFTNPAENRVWLRLCVLDGSGRTLGETGLLRPGEYVRAVVLDEPLPAGTPVTIRVTGCQPETYRCAGAVVMSTAVCGVLP